MEKNFEKLENFNGYRILYFGITQNEGVAGCSLSISNELNYVTIHFNQAYAEQFSEQLIFNLFPNNFKYPCTDQVLYQCTDSLFSSYLNQIRDAKRLSLNENAKDIFKHHNVYNELFEHIDICNYFFLSIEGKYLHVLAKSISIVSGDTKNIFTKYIADTNF